MGKFYVNAADAEAALTRSGIKGGEVGLVFLNEVYFPLIMKTAKLDIFPGSSVVGKAVAAGLADKPFRIIPDQTEVASPTPIPDAHPNPNPIIRTPTLALTLTVTLCRGCQREETRRSAGQW